MMANERPMTQNQIARQRLLNQRLAGNPFEKPEEVVRWLGAVQAQDYAGAKWALGLRLRHATDEVIERAFTDGSILRTHLMRPTWHFVTPADIRWMLALTARRAHTLNAGMYRKLELDGETLRRSTAALVDALQGGLQRTREEMREALQQAGIAAQDGQRLAYIMMHAEFDGIICSGPRRGKQFTYMLLEERAPKAISLESDEALAELVRRYFFSHGPATEHDFVWWSRLTLTDARKGLAVIGSELETEVIDGRTYWFLPAAAGKENSSHTAYLLPNYDELGSYQDRSAILDPGQANELALSHIILIYGKVAGSWMRTLKKQAVLLETDTFAPLSEAENRAVGAAAQRYGAFLGMPVTLV